MRVSMPALLTMMSSRPKAVDRGVDEALEVVDLADVGLDADGLVAEGGDLLLELLGGLLVGHVVDDDVGALPRRGPSTTALPMPLLPPVTMATLPFSVMVSPPLVRVGLLSASRSTRCSPTRIALAIAVSAGFTAPMLGKKLVSTT